MPGAVAKGEAQSYARRRGEARKIETLGAVATEPAMKRPWTLATLLSVAACGWYLIPQSGSAWAIGSPKASEGGNPQSSVGNAEAEFAQKTTEQSGSAQKSTEQGQASRFARGKKLVLRDGNFQLVRSYERNGERVRYFSLERGTWEEIPASLVDWEATKKAEAESEKSDAALLSKVHAQEEATKIETTLDVDASLQVAPGVFLPPGEGMFVIQGKSVTPLEQVGSQVRTDKKQVFKQVLSPVPIIPSKHNVEIPGPKATIRVNSAAPEFYLREAPPDPDRDGPIQRSSRPGEYGPDVELVRATVKGNKRQLEQIKSLFGQQVAQDRHSVSIQRWEVARTVFRFTLSEPLQPGEYALAEILPDGMSLYVWDFGVDGSTPGEPARH